MARILSNEALSQGFYLMKVQGGAGARMGQFYMLRAWEQYPVLSRPLSVFDAEGDTLTFLYRVAGQGTQIFSEKKPGEEITLDGPHGNGFPPVKGRVALVGGGAGVAPLYLAAKTLKGQEEVERVDLYLGFSREAILTREYEEVAHSLKVNVGGFITDDIDPGEYDAILTCGPEVMMEALYQKCRSQERPTALYVSMEKRMACGFGTCLVCTCKTDKGRRRVCTDGPVFRGEEVFGHE